MAETVVRDYCIWAKHIVGDPELIDRILAMPPGAVIALSVDGIVGRWQKMADGANGEPTPGLRPLDRMKQVWGSYFRDKRGEVVRIAAARFDGAVDGEGSVERSTATEAERLAALRALFDVTKGWRSEEPYGPREELYDR